MLAVRAPPGIGPGADRIVEPEDAEDLSVNLSDVFNNDPTYQVGPKSEATATIAATNMSPLNRSISGW